MSSKPKLLFVYDMVDDKYWMDGLYMALNVLEQDFEIKRLNIHTPAITMFTKIDGSKYDFILGWGAFNSLVDVFLKTMIENRDKCKFGLCIGGCATPPVGVDYYDILFFETKWQFREQLNYLGDLI